MKPHPAWKQLTATARRAPDGRDAAAPAGFAARVAALALAAERRPASISDHFSMRVSLRVLGAAAAVALVSAGVTYPSTARLFHPAAEPAAVFPSSPPAPDSHSPALPAAAPRADAAAPSAGDDPVADVVDAMS